MRSVERIVGCSINTVTELLCDVGAACVEYHDKNVCTLQSKRIGCDEIWSLCYAKQKNVATAKAEPEGAGDVWTWTAIIDADSKMIISYLLGGRDAEYALEFWTICAHVLIIGFSLLLMVINPTCWQLKIRLVAM